MNSLLSLAQSLMSKFGYFGIFLTGIISTSGIFISGPPFYLLIFFSTVLGLNPFLAGLTASVGCALGELSGYMIGWTGGKVLKKKYKLKKVERWFMKNGFLTILLFAATPLPDDLTAILAGMVKYNIGKFLTACMIGKVILCLTITYSGKLAFSLWW